MHDPRDPQTSLTTERLHVDRFTGHDADDLVSLLNEPGWLRFIGDRNVHNNDDAIAYLDNARATANASLGLFALRLRSDHRLLGMCTLIQRDYLQYPDIGFALFDKETGKGFAFEGTQRLMRYAFEDLALPKLSAITLPDNKPSIALLTRLGFSWLEDRTVAAADGSEETLNHYMIAAGAGPAD